MNRNRPWYSDPPALLIAMFLAALLAPPKVKAAEWDTTEKVMFGSLVTLQLIDVAQTWKIKDNPDRWREVNPIFGEDPNMAAVIGLKAAITGGVYWLVRDSPNVDRKLLLGVANSIQLGIVGHNYSIGLKLGF